MKDREMTPRARAAYEWLMENNATYARWQRKHQEAILKGLHAVHGYVFQTWNLLLHSPGIEVAAFPLLYPQPSFGDTDVRERLMELSWISENAKPSIGFSYMKKVTSPCMSYAQEATTFDLDTRHPAGKIDYAKVGYGRETKLDTRSHNLLLPVS